jgi:fucose permease
LILASIIAIFVYGMIAAMLGTVLPVLSDRFKLSPSQNGSIAFAQAFGLIIASLAVGPLLDAKGDKAGMVLGLFLISVALFTLPRVANFRGVLLLFFLLGVAGGVTVTAANALASDVGEAHRATALNLANVFFGLGAMATPFVAANFFGRNWVRLCYSMASLAVVTLMIEIFTKMPGPTASGRFILSEVGPVLGHPLLLLTALFTFLYITCEVGVWNWLPRHLVAQGIPEARALNILSLGFALGMLLGRVAILPVLSHVPAVRVTLVGSLAMAITTFMMLQARTSKAAWVLVFLAGLSMAPVFPTTLAIVGNAFPRMTGTAIGFVITCGWTGLAVSSRIIGFIAGGDPRRLKKALLVIPASSVIMVGLDLVIRGMLR